MTITVQPNQIFKKFIDDALEGNVDYTLLDVINIDTPEDAMFHDVLIRLGGSAGEVRDPKLTTSKEVSATIIQSTDICDILRKSGIDGASYSKYSSTSSYMSFFIDTTPTPLETPIDVEWYNNIMRIEQGNLQDFKVLNENALIDANDLTAVILKIKYDTDTKIVKKGDLASFTTTIVCTETVKESALKYLIDCGFKDATISLNVSYEENNLYDVRLV